MAESHFPFSCPRSKTTGSGSGFLEMSAFVCCVSAVALGRSSSGEVMHRLEEEEGGEGGEDASIVLSIGLKATLLGCVQQHAASRAGPWWLRGVSSTRR